MFNAADPVHHQYFLDNVERVLMRRNILTHESARAIRREWFAKDGIIRAALDLTKEELAAEHGIRGQVTDRCNAQDWEFDEEGDLIIYGTCGKPAGHEERFHQEWRDGKLWAEWAGLVETVPPR